MGKGWYPYETFSGESFRWVENDAEIRLDGSAAPGCRLSFEIEPGPGLGSMPFTLHVLNLSGSPLTTLDIQGRQTYSVVLPIEPDQKNSLLLHVDGGGVPTPGDSRTLNFRVFSISMDKLVLLSSAGERREIQDIVLNNDVVYLGSGWHALEYLADQAFRWVENDAQLVVRPSAADAVKLEFEIEPGPGVGSKPFILDVLASGRFYQQFEIVKRQKEICLFPTNPASASILQLRFKGGGARAPQNRQSLSYRVFGITGTLLRAESKSLSPLTGSHTDILTPTASLFLGTGWYPVESNLMKRFRWVNNDAEFVVIPEKRSDVLSVELEPGPGVESKPFQLQILNSRGELVGSSLIQGHQQTSLSLPMELGRANTFRFHVDRSGKRIPNDPRILNFRVFKMELIGG